MTLFLLIASIIMFLYTVAAICYAIEIGGQLKSWCVVGGLASVAYLIWYCVK